MSLATRSYLYFCVALLLTSCATVDPAVDFDGYRKISLQQKLHKAKRALSNDNQHLALYWYRVAQSIAPDNTMIQQQTRQLQQTLHIQAKQQFDKGERAKRNGRYTQAKKHLLKALALQPEHHQALTSLKELDLLVMLIHRGSPPLFKNGPSTNQKPSPIDHRHQQQSKLLQQATRSLKGNQLFGSISLIQMAVGLGVLSPAGEKQVVEIYWGLSRAYLNQYNIDLAYQFYRKGKEAHKSTLFNPSGSADELSTLLSKQLYQRGRESFPHKISQALYYWEACAYVDKNHRDVNGLLTMARRYKDRLDSLGREP